MGRLIEFRSWDASGKVFNYLPYAGSFEVNINSYNPMIQFYRYTIYGKVDCAFMYPWKDLQQKVGLPDRKNIPLYEGDIIKQEFNTVDDPQSMIEDYQWSKKRWEVVWNEYQYQFGLMQLNPTNREIKFQHLPVDSSHFEIVGHIHDKDNIL